MILIRCFLCRDVRDSDDDPEGFYTLDYPHEFICVWCREERDLHSEHDNPREDHHASL